MRLGINGWRIHGQRTGVGRYLLNIVRHWDREMIGGRFEEVVLYTPKPIDRSQIPLPENIQSKVLRPDARMLVWENLRFGPAAREDVLFCPSFTRPLVARGKCVVTIFEATLKLYPEQFPTQRGHMSPAFYLNLYQWSGAHATLVLTSTHAAKMDLIRAYRIPEEKIRVVYLAAPDDFVPYGTATEHSAIRRKYLGADEPFFLYVGKMTPRRNVPKLMQAFRELKRDPRIPHKLLVIGKNITEIDIQSLARELEITQDFAHVEYIPDDDLLLLYNAAHVFVLPYSYEAVSLPVIEAQRTGLPVITMDAPGLREVSGDAAVYLRQAEVADIREAMRTLATDAGLYRDLAARGLEFSQRFSWRRTAAETLTVLEEAAQT